ncbi:hypothetical protein F4859DRAFT_510243 [Xylaria cf. heliscus]|nr:hypothetical protein F4859DRAFT_510243 [Xylaria cf. heliscus]
MSNADLPPPAVEGDIWVENAALIRRLYVSERKTLKKVKEVLESQHGFPIFPLSTYETRLRDKLKLRKKLKRDDWTAVYQHFQNRGGKETGIYLNGMRIPWERAWKEIRRSGSRSVSDGQLRELPAGVAVRSPSPEMSPTLSFSLASPPASSMAIPIRTQLASASMNLQVAIPSIAPTSSYDTITYSSTMPYIGATNIERRFPMVSNDFDPLYHRVFLEAIPMNTFRKHMHSMISNNSQGPYNSGAGSSQHFGVAILGDIMDVIFGLNSRISSSTISFQQPKDRSSVPALNFDSYHFLTQAMYLFSNKTLHQSRTVDIDNLRKMFDILFTRLDKRVLLHFLRSNLPTTRSALETLVQYAYILRDKNAFSCLLRVSIERPSWLLDNGQRYLWMAASLGSLDAIRCLLKIGVRADDENYKSYLSSAIVHAVEAGSIACVEALIQRCDVNRTISQGRESNFGLFFSAMGSNKAYINGIESFVEGKLKLYPLAPCWRPVKFSLDNEMHDKVLGMFLDHGADVDSQWCAGLFEDPISRIHTKNHISPKWKLSLLDQAYYLWDTRLYAKLRPYSSREATQITRPGICLSAKRGKECLQAYLESRPPQHPDDTTRLLELVLAEQFFREDFNIATQVVQGLVNFGVDITLPTMRTNCSLILFMLVVKANWFGFNDTVAFLLELLVCKGAMINQDVVAAAVPITGVGLLPRLVDYGANIQEYGARALCTAARLNNFEAVSWLLQTGVDINAGISTVLGTKTIIALSTLGACFGSLYRFIRCDTPMSNEMLAYLIGRGARLRLSPCDSSSYEFLKAIMKASNYYLVSVDKRKFFLEFAHCPGDFATDQESLLASWTPDSYPHSSEIYVKRSGAILDMYELLLERGCPIRRECQLAFFILYGGRHEVVHKLLDAGADVNAYSKRRVPYTPILVKQYPIQAAAAKGDTELLIQLMRRGADINQPAIGHAGRTALQHACEYAALFTADQTVKLGLIKTLINLGADVNAPAGKWSGMTALQIASYYGDIVIALFLLEHGANVNAPPAKDYDDDGEPVGFCALDAAASQGRLDMVHLLLSIAAHSHNRGSTGYEGAIRLAHINGHYTVAELIREYITTFGNCIIVDLESDNQVTVQDDSSESSDDEILDYFHFEFDIGWGSDSD